MVESKKYKHSNTKTNTKNKSRMEQTVTNLGSLHNTHNTLFVIIWRIKLLI